LSRSSSYGEKFSSEKQARDDFNKLLSTILERDVYANQETEPLLVSSSYV